jgi:hypothetical protein
MASAQITFSNVTIALEDEDRTAKSLSKLAVKTLGTVVSSLAGDDDEKGTDELDEEKDVEAR